MGKNYDAYQMARQAEIDSKARALIDDTQESITNAEQAEINAHVTWGEFMEDPNG